MSQLALDQRQRDALVQQLDSMGMAELVVVPTSAQPPLSPPVVWVSTTSTNGAFGRPGRRICSPWFPRQ